MSKNGYFDDTRAAARKRRRKALFSSLTWAVIGACIAIFFFLYSGDYDPIAREDAASYTLQFDRYEVSNSSKRASVIYFTDGSYFSVPLSVESDGFLNTVKSMSRGTTLFVLVNPQNNCVIELKTETSELLNFDDTQRQIAADGAGYRVIALIVIGLALLLLVCSIIEFLVACRVQVKREADEATANAEDLSDSIPLRSAESDVRHRVLLEARVAGYKICYRRVGSVNELVVNGFVYAERKGIIEFTHALTALIDGHRIEAGLDENSYSYITLDGELLEYRERLL